MNGDALLGGVPLLHTTISERSVIVRYSKRFVVIVAMLIVVSSMVSARLLRRLSSGFGSAECKLKCCEAF